MSLLGEGSLPGLFAEASSGPLRRLTLPTPNQCLAGVVRHFHPARAIRVCTRTVICPLRCSRVPSRPMLVRARHTGAEIKRICDTIDDRHNSITDAAHVYPPLPTCSSLQRTPVATTRQAIGVVGTCQLVSMRPGQIKPTLAIRWLTLAEGQRVLHTIASHHATALGRHPHLIHRH